MQAPQQMRQGRMMTRTVMTPRDRLRVASVRNGCDSSRAVRCRYAAHFQEAASIKQHEAEGSDCRASRVSARRPLFAATNVPLIILIATAWRLPFQGPRFSYPPQIMRDRYDVQAKASPDTFPPGISTRDRDEKMRLMLQSLLTERYRLRIVHETKVVPVYVLTVRPKMDPGWQKPRSRKRTARLSEPCRTEASRPTLRLMVASFAIAFGVAQVRAYRARR